MGIFKFLKNAGQKYVDVQKNNLEMVKDIFDGDDDKKKAHEKASEEVKRQMEQAEAIRQAAMRNGLGGDFRVMVEGETVKLEGKVPDQETLEKVVLTAGNIEGVGEVDVAGMEAEKGGEPAVFYTVQKGDSLSKIAKQFLGDAMKYPVIFEANKPMLSDPDKIYPGQTLRIPGGKAQA